MRILGFEKKWPKLEKSNFTTFRFARKDRDWQVGEEVQIIYKPRSKEREISGYARIVNITLRNFVSPYSIFGGSVITSNEARKDGFASYVDMKDWFYKQYGDRIFNESLNKLTLTWVMKLTSKGRQYDRHRQLQSTNRS